MKENLNHFKEILIIKGPQFPCFLLGFEGFSDIIQKKPRAVLAAKLIHAEEHFMQTHEIKVLATIETDFHEKFGIPRQSGLVDSLRARIVFEPEFRNADALRGIEGFSHLWLIWQFSRAVRSDWSPTVRPPRLGGNARLGVFATRSPFRPNALGLSCVRLEQVCEDSMLGPVLIVSGADLLNGTPIYDIKPYLPYADCHPEAVGGFAPAAPEKRLQVQLSEELSARIPAEKRAALLGVLALDPRPSYHDDPTRIYGMRFADYEVRFSVVNGVLTVLELQAIP